MSECRFLLLDGRAKTLSAEDAFERCAILDTADTEHEARIEGKRTWGDHDAIWLDCDTATLRWDLPPAKATGRQP